MEIPAILPIAATQLPRRIAEPYFPAGSQPDRVESNHSRLWRENTLALRTNGDAKVMISRAFIGALIFLLVSTGAALSAPKRVLLLHSFTRDFGPSNAIAKSIRMELAQRSSSPIDFSELSLVTARYADSEEEPFVEYLAALFSKRPLDLVITTGAPAADFIRKHRQNLFSTVPALFTALERRRVAPEYLTGRDAAVAIHNDYPRIIENILEVLPKTTNVTMILGSSPLERFWTEQLKVEFQPFEKRVAFTWTNDMSFEEVLKHISTLPPQSAIFFGLMSVDAAGVSHEEGEVFTRVHAVANAPIFSYIDLYFGQGVVGGPLSRVDDVGRLTASVAVGMLDGKVPNGVRLSSTEFGAPKFDWRELQRWNISESRLPQGSEIYFREPGMWERYRIQVSAGIAALLLQAGIISLLLVERRRRSTAQAEASNRRREVIRLNRVTTANVLSSSIAHELNQPLGAILSNTEAAQLLLEANPPDLAQIREILGDIVRDEQRVGEIILGLRNLLSNKSGEDLRPTDVNDNVREVVRVVSPEVAKRGVVLRTILAAEALPVRSDPIHLQQVMLNLVMNGMDAMEQESTPHNLTIRTLRSKESDAVEVRISDSGKGIPEKSLTSIFDAFVTTKPQGTGLGLPIARTIVESYGGEVWAENRMRGAVFSFRLPLAKVT
jgi:signal transduction histidine kinase